jgi:hypothetical protein
MKFDILFAHTGVDKKEKPKERKITIEAPNINLATDWAELQAKQWKLPQKTFKVTQFVEPVEESEVVEEL